MERHLETSCSFVFDSTESLRWRYENRFLTGWLFNDFPFFSLRAVRFLDEHEHRHLHQVTNSVFFTFRRKKSFSFRDFEKTEKSIEDYRNEILLHGREKDKLEKNIPLSITIGPYFVSAQKLREALSNKRKALVEALLLSQTRKARTKSEEVKPFDTFRSERKEFFLIFFSWTTLSATFNENSSRNRATLKICPNIENGWNRFRNNSTIKKFVARFVEAKNKNRTIFCFQDDIQKILEEFSMLDEFFCNLSNEDFAMK